MIDDNEQRMAYERIINHKFADMVDQYGERPLLDANDVEFIFGPYPSLEGPEDYYECYHDPSRWRCNARRGPRNPKGPEYPLY